MPIPIPLNYVIEKASTRGGDTERRRLKRLAGVSLSSEHARSAWPRILEHKWYMSERMGRDVGLRVAAVDFFQHVQPPPRRGPVLARALGRVPLADPVRWLERVLSSFTGALRGARAIALLIS